MTQGETTNVISMDSKRGDDDEQVPPSDVDQALAGSRRKQFPEPVINLDEEVIAAAQSKAGNLLAAAKPQHLELEDVNIEEWLVIGEALVDVEASIQWWVGDWLVYGQELFPEQWAQGLNPHTMDPNRTRNWEYVSRRYPALDDRFPLLSWTHHYIAAKADNVEKRRELLNFALANGMATREFRQYVERALMGAIDEEEGPTDLPATHVKLTLDVIVPLESQSDLFEVGEKGRHAIQREANQRGLTAHVEVKTKEVRDKGAAAA